MTPQETQQLQQALDIIADILYHNTPEDQLEDFEAIELTLRQQWLDTLGPHLAKKFYTPHPN